MLNAIKRFIHSAVHNYDTRDAPLTRATPPDMTVLDAVTHGSRSIAVIFRIDNGFVLNIGSNSHDGSRCSLVFAKDAQEVAEQIVANEAAFKLGLRGGGNASDGIKAPHYAPNIGASAFKI